MKILAMKWRRLGDTVLWTSALQALKDMGADLHLLYPKEYKDLFQKDPRFPNQFFVSHGVVDASTVEVLKSEEYDYVLNFHASQSSAKFAKSLGAKKVIVHSHDRNPNPLGSDLPIPNLGIPMRATERDLNLVRAIGWTGIAPPVKLRNPIGAPPTQEKALLYLAPRASRPAKEWPQDRYLALAKALAPHFTLRVLGEHLDTWGDRYLREQLFTIAPPLSTPTVGALLETLAQGTYFVGSDSGLKHMAASLNLKTVTLFGPESIGEWHCYDGQKALQIPVSCRDHNPEQPTFSWCGVYQCPLASHSCMSLITVNSVVEAIRSPF